MAKIIEFYIPQSFRKVSKWLPPSERGAAGVPNGGTKIRMTWRAEIPWRRRIVRAEGAAKSGSLRHR
jgi:hypothetical protein